MIPRAFVAGLHLRWDGVWQRPHHLLSRIAREIPVVVLEEPFAAHADRDDVRVDGGVSVVRPLRVRGWAPPFADDAALATMRRIAGDAPCGVWLYTPAMAALADAFAARPLVYDVMDELAAFDVAPAGIAEADAAVAARADVVFAGGATLAARRAHLGAKVHAEPSGVEVERFAADAWPHPLTGALRGPVFGYAGVIDERLDYEVIAALADAFPGGHVVLVGPVVKVDPARIARRPNVHLTGAQPYASLPSWYAGFDVALMPFARNRATATISPTKTLEYFAARRPVVSTPIADVVAAYGEIVYVADGAAAFVDAARAALAADPARIVAGFDAARRRTWDAIAARMLATIAALPA